jgi:hypothetical protein
MWRAAISEALDVVLGTGAVGVDRGVVFAHLLSQQLRLVDTLGARADLLATHEEIVRVRELRVMRRRHCVSRADVDRELVEDVEVGVVLLKDQAAEVLFLGCAALRQFHRRESRDCPNLPQVVVVVQLLACFAQHLDTLCERNSRHLARLRKLELIDVVDTANEVRLALEAYVQLLEDEQHEILKHTHNLVVVLLEFHLEIKTSELGQVASSVGVLGTENRPDLHDPLEARRYQHLLVELWRLRKVCRAAEVVQFEDVGTSFRSGTQDLGSLDQGEVLLREELLEDCADTALDPEDRLIDLSPQVDRSVVEPGVKADERSLAALFLLLLFGSSGLGRQGSLAIIDLQRQWDLGLGLDEQLLDVDLKVLDGGALDGLGCLLHQASDDNGALGGNGAAELDHLLAQLVTGGNDSLDGVKVLAQVQEG